MENHKDNLLYLEGFLDSISYINTFDNDGKTYTVELVEKVNSNFQDTIRKLHNVKNWIITTELIKDNWRETLKRDLRPYFDQIIVEVFKKTNQISLFDEKGNINQQVNELIEKVRLDNRFYIDHLLQEKFLDKLEMIVGKQPQLYKIEIDWQPKDKEYEGYYEGHCNDFLFDLGNQVLFIHFGSSD